ncbi:hypothetical protein D779_0246 [Imhoffiella purpurea]|uniref:Uncharacterized protein n=1 Tax=Imhoffiella purpurea TaxID=1249627 RepID=W9UVE2_9GAMM|nr:hypothetical protein D779_0246 [Imhoffiella purpurea]
MPEYRQRSGSSPNSISVALAERRGTDRFDPNAVNPFHE